MNEKQASTWRKRQIGAQDAVLMTRWDAIVGQFMTSAEGRPVFIVPPSVKLCPKCKQIKPRDQFYARQSHSQEALLPNCKPCHIEAQKERLAAKKKAARAAMTPEQKAAEAQRQREKHRKRNAAQATGKFEWPEDA